MPLYTPETPLVGRADEMSRLRDALGSGTGGGGIALLSGDAGIGKSRLLAALAQERGAAGTLVAAGYCVGLGAAPAYLPISDLLGELAVAEPDAVAEVAAAHPVLGLLVGGLPAVPWHVAGPEGSVEYGAPHDPTRVAAAVHACLEAVARRRPVLAVVEDVHWADNSSRDLLTVLFTRGFAGPVGLVASYRSDDLHRRHPLHETLGVWARLPRVGRVDLGGLPDDAMRALVGGLRDAPTSTAAIDDVVARADGNAFFAEELVAGGAGVSGDLGRVLWLRIEQLGDDARTLVRAMSVGGRRVSADLLAAVLGRADTTPMTGAGVDSALREAMERHLLLRVEGDLAFRHALVAEASYDDLLPSERIRLHAAYAAVLRDRPDLGGPADLSRHAHAAGDDEVAVVAALAAGDEAMGLGGPADALTHFEDALRWAPADHPERDVMVQRASGAASSSGNYVRAFQLLKDAVDHPSPHQTMQTRAVLLGLLAMRSRALDSPFDVLGVTEEALGLVADDAPVELRAHVLTARLQALVDAGRYADAIALADDLARLAEAEDLPLVGAETRAILGRVVEAQQDTEALRVHLESVRADLEGTDDAVLVRVCHNLAGVYHREGDLRRAHDLVAEGRAVAERRRRPFAPWAVECRLLEGTYAFELGDWDRAGDLLDTPVTLVRDTGQALLAAGGLVLRTARGDDVTPEEIDRLLQWSDGLVAQLSCAAAVELVARPGDAPAAATLLREAVGRIDVLWGTEYQGIVRLTALAVGACATAVEVSAADDPEVDGLLADLGPYVLRCRERMAQDDRYVGAESRAWALRLEGEWARLVRVAGRHGLPVDPLAPPAADEAGTWRAAVAAMADYGNVYETARARFRLADALRGVGRDDDEACGQARAEAAAAYGVARRLGAGPLRAELA